MTRGREELRATTRPDTRIHLSVVLLVGIVLVPSIAQAELRSETLRYDDARRVTRMTYDGRPRDPIVALGYGYDQAIVSSPGSGDALGVLSQAFALDGVGNRTSVTSRSACARRARTGSRSTATAR